MLWIWKYSNILYIQPCTWNSEFQSTFPTAYSSPPGFPIGPSCSQIPLKSSPLLRCPSLTVALPFLQASRLIILGPPLVPTCPLFLNPGDFTSAQVNPFPSVAPGELPCLSSEPQFCPYISDDLQFLLPTCTNTRLTCPGRTPVTSKLSSSQWLPVLNE